MIDDPELLLNSISSGQIDVISDRNTGTHDSIWSSEIENMFLSPKTTNPFSSSSLTSTKRKPVTSHRLLTSTEVLQEKRNMENEKQEKLKLKLEREVKEKRKLKIK